MDELQLKAYGTICELLGRWRSQEEKGSQEFDYIRESEINTFEDAAETLCDITEKTVIKTIIDAGRFYDLYNLQKRQVLRSEKLWSKYFKNHRDG